jgi:hypothetical protein
MENDLGKVNFNMHVVTIHELLSFNAPARLLKEISSAAGRTGTITLEAGLTTTDGSTLRALFQDEDHNADPDTKASLSGEMFLPIGAKHIANIRLGVPFAAVNIPAAWFGLAICSIASLLPSSSASMTVNADKAGGVSISGRFGHGSSILLSLSHTKI